MDSLITQGDRPPTDQAKAPPPQIGDGNVQCAFWTNAAGQIECRHFRTTADRFYQPHSHSDYCVTVCLEGRIVRTEFGQTYTASPGDAFISHPGVAHASHYRREGAKACETVGLTFARPLLLEWTADFGLPGGADHSGVILTGRFANRVVHSCAQALAQELQRRRPGYWHLLEALAKQVLGELLRAWPRDQVAVTKADTAVRLSQRDFLRAYEFMRSCPKEAFRVQRLCSFLGSSEENFTRLFSATMNCPPAAFYNRMLLQRGGELLRSSRRSIKEISFALGFKTTSHFIAAFRRSFGVSPQKYRQPVRDSQAHCEFGPETTERLEMQPF